MSKKENLLDVFESYFVGNQNPMGMMIPDVNKTARWKVRGKPNEDEIVATEEIKFLELVLKFRKFNGMSDAEIKKLINLLDNSETVDLGIELFNKIYKENE